MGRLDGKVALITGAARGQGAEEARRFVAEGARVVLADVNDDGKQLADELGADARFRHHDVSSEQDWADTVAETLAEWGRVDVLVNNAAILHFSAIAETALADYERVIRINQFGCFLGMRSVIPNMIENGGGSIVNVSSIEGLAGMAYMVAYGASKFAIRGMTKVAAMELGPQGIRVNSVHPGGVLTSMTLGQATTADPADAEAFLKAMPMSRFARPAEISCLVAYLASDESSYSTGSEFLADGGILSGPGY